MGKNCKVRLSLAIFSFTILSCTKVVTSPLQISGVWVETNDRLDTLVFGYDNVLELKRGKRHAALALFSPSSGAGLYKYFLNQDSISLNYLAPGKSALQSYSFKLQADILYISDFYRKSQGSGNLLTFKRLK